MEEEHLRKRSNDAQKRIKENQVLKKDLEEKLNKIASFFKSKLDFLPTQVFENVFHNIQAQSDFRQRLTDSINAIIGTYSKTESIKTLINKDLVK